LRALHAGDGLIAIGLRLLLRLAARPVARHQCVLPVELQFHAPGSALRGNKRRQTLNQPRTTIRNHPRIPLQQLVLNCHPPIRSVSRRHGPRQPVLLQHIAQAAPPIEASLVRLANASGDK